MFRFSPLILSCMFLLAACTTPANPTPIIIVVTATPSTGSATQLPPPTATLSAGSVPTPAAAETSAALQPTASNLKPTTVKYVLAKQDINIRKGPGTNFEIVGGVYAGQTAQVTGFKSEDEQWWRVVCPVDNVTECWVSADTSLTEPADAPNVGPTATGTTEVNVEAFTRQLAAAFQSNDQAALKALMDDPFTIAYWRSEGTSPTRDEALLLLKNWLDAQGEIVFDLANKTDQTKLLDGTNPTSLWDPKIQVVKSVYVTGLKERTEALLVIAKRADGTLYWYGMLVAGNGGFEAMNR